MEYWNALSAIATAATAIVALFAIGLEKRRNREEVKCIEAKECLKLAYDSLMKDSKEGVPKAHRLNWMMSARFIIRFYEIESEVKMEEYKKVLDGQRMVWLVLFAEAIGKVTEYYIGKGMRVTKATPGYFLSGDIPLEQTSVAIVLDFAIWKVDINDPLSRSKLTAERLATVLEVYPSTKQFLDSKHVLRN